MKNIIFTILSFSFLLSCNSIEESKIINKKSSQLTYSQLINLDNNFSYERYDDSDLDGAGNHYSWVNENDSSAFIKVIDSKTKETHYFLKRRYWFAQRKKSIFCKAFELLKKQ